MILRGFKNFAKSIKYYFTPLGVLTVFVIIGLSICISGISAAIQNLFNDLAKTMGDMHIDFGQVGGNIYNSYKELNGDISQLLSLDWIMHTLISALMESSLGDTVDSATEAITNCGMEIIRLIVLFFILFIIGIIAGHVILSIQVRYEVIKDKWWKVLLYCLFDALIQVGILVLFIVLISVWGPFIFIAPILLLIVSEALSILGAYFIHAFKKVKFVEIFNAKTIFLSLLADLILSILGVGLIILIALIFKSIVAVLIGLPLLQIIMVVSRLSAETYTVSKLEETKTAQQ